MKKHLFLFIVTSFVAICTYSQTPQILWQKSLGGTKDETPNCIQQTVDGGYITAGFSHSNDGDVSGHHNSTSKQDFWIVKTDNTGTIEWQKSLGGSEDDYATSIQQTFDGGYIVTGASNSTNGNVTINNGGNDIWLVKLDASGAIVWQKSFGGSLDDEGFCVRQTLDSGYIMAGESHSSNGDVTSNNGGEDYWVIKVDTSGTIQWQKSYGGTLDDAANSIELTSDGGYILTGFSLSNDGDISGHHSNADYWVVKIDNLGTIQWQKSLGGAEDDYGTSVKQTNDGGYIVCGYAQSNDGDATVNYGGWDAWVVKLDDTGLLQWQKSVGGSLNDKAYSVSQTMEGGYVIACVTNSVDGDVTNNYGDKDSWIVKFDAVGNVEWQKSFGGTLTDVAFSVQQIANTGYIVASSSNSNDGDVTGNHGLDDFWLVNFCIPSATTLNQIACDSLTLNAVTYTVSGTYFQTLTNISGCDSIITLNLTVVNTPVMTSTAAVNLCSGDQLDVHFSSTSVATYIWRTTNNLNISGESSTLQTSSILNNTLGNNTGVSQLVSYTVTPTTTVGGCVGTPQVINVTVYAPVTSTISASGPLTFCQGNSVILTASAGSSFEWRYSTDGNSYVNTASTQSITVTVSGFYKVEVTDANGCKKNSTPTTVVVNPLPVMTSIVSAAICSGAVVSIPLTSNISSSYSWIATDNVNTAGESTTTQSSSTLSNAIINNTIIPQNVIYTVTPTSATGLCEGATQTVTVTVNPLPAMNSATSKIICSADTVNIAFTSDVASSYLWRATDNPNTTGESTTSQTSISLSDIIINTSAVPQTVSYTVTPLSDAGSCYGAAQVISVTVNPSPVMTNTATASICSDNTLNISLTSNISADYFWVANDNINTTGESIATQNSTIINDVINNPTASTESIVYYVTPVSSNGGCYGNIQTISVHVNPLPVMSNVSSSSICSGTSPDITLSSDVTSSYYWMADDNANTTGESIAAQNTGVINDVLNNTSSVYQIVTYTVMPVSSLGGCTGTSQIIDITVFAPASTAITASGATTFCDGNNVTLTATSAVSYLWSNSSQSQSITVFASGTYSVTTLNSDGCSSTSAPMVVTAIPHHFNISISANPQFGSAPLFVAFNNNTPNRTNYTYSWTFGDGTTSISNAGTVFHQYSFNGLYDVSLVATSIATGCTDTLVLTGYINVINGTSCTHTATVTPSGTAFSCRGDSLLLTCNSDNSYTYQWNINSTAISGANSSTLAVTQNGYYSVTIMQAGCPVTSSATQAVFNAKPPVPVITAYGAILSCVGGSVTFVASDNVTGLNYVWNTSSTNDSITVTNSGNYSVTAIEPATGCGSTSAIYHLNASAAPPVPICLVTVDSLSSHNILYWSNPNDRGIDSFRVYREVATNIYSHIGSVAFDSLSEYHDYSANPNTTSYRYKLSAVDTCGTETYLSEFHSTIHLQVLAGGNLQWSLYDIENQPNPVTYYVIERDTNNSGNFYPISSNVPGNNAFYTDTDYTLYPNASYRAEVAWNISCTPTRTTIITSRSNIRHGLVTGNSTSGNDKSVITIYPNPFTNDFTISASGEIIKEIKILDMLGNVVLQSTSLIQGRHQLIMDLSNESKGIYFVQILTEKGVVNKKIIKN